jgi:fructose-1,6-bisphosphatase I
MGQGQTLGQHLDGYADSDLIRRAVADAVGALAAASTQISDLTSNGLLAGITGQAQGCNSGGDVQKDLDIRADQLIRAALARISVAAFASEEANEIEILNPAGSISVAIDPLDGSSNIEANMTVGTIFSIVPTPEVISTAFMQPGSVQLAAGFVVYGPQTSLVLTLGCGVNVFTLDRNDKIFKLVKSQVQIAPGTAEFAINASNHRHWEAPIQAYIDDCIAGNEGLLAKDFNMRWIGSLVAEAYRILMRGGIFLYPADARDGYGEGRLRLVYEAHPMAFIMEQAGGAASTGRLRVLDLVANTLHQRVPLIMGSIECVQRLERMHMSPDIKFERNAPLFATRGLFRN